MTITIELPAETAERLAERARERNVSVEEFARDSLIALADAPATISDDEFERIAAYVVEKNAELYRRLARPT